MSNKIISMTSEQTSFSDKDHEMRLKSLEKTSKWS